MRLKIARIDKSLPLPAYQTPGSVAFDLYPRMDVSLTPGEQKVVPGNVIIEVPKGFFLLIVGRSSSAKRGLLVNLGVLDQDYHGPEDELLLSLRNISSQSIEIKRGERIAQGLILPVEKVTKWEEVEQIKSGSRGGYGSTGK